MTLHKIMVGAAVGVGLVAAPFAAVAQPADEVFLKKVVMGDTGEIAIGRMIAQKGAAPETRAFGAMLVSQHTASRAKAEALAKSRSIETSETLGSQMQQTRSRLSSLSGAAFDRRVRSDAIEDHEKDIRAYEAEAKTGDPQTAAFARSTLPTLRMHLSMAEALPKR